MFISYGTEDTELADEFRTMLEKGRRPLKCFMAKHDIGASQEWEQRILEAMRASRSLLALLTPDSFKKSWVVTECGAAWGLGISVYPAILHVDFKDLPESISKHQGRQIKTTEQRKNLVREIREVLQQG